MLVPNFGSDCENGVDFGIGGRYRSKRTLVGVKAQILFSYEGMPRLACKADVQ